MKLLRSILILTAIITFQTQAAPLTKEGTQQLLDSFQRDKDIAVQKVLKRTKEGMNIQMSMALYLCEVHDRNLVIQLINEMYPQYAKSHKSLVDRADKDEKELQELNKSLGKDPNEACRNVPVN